MKQIALQTVEGLTQSIKGLARTKTDLPQQEGVLPADGLRARAAQFPGLSLHTHTHTPYCFCFSGGPLLIQNTMETVYDI